MSGRSDIKPGSNGWRRLSYTCNCGWVDWGHALPGSALELKRQTDNEKPGLSILKKVDVTLEGDPAYILVYGQAMGAGPIRVSTRRHWIVKKNLTNPQKMSAALGIFLNASFRFERLQGAFPFSIVSGASSFSPEDLVSNLIGFFSAYKSIPQVQMRKICGEVSVDESYRVWDEHLPNGLSGLRNRSPRPILFPCPECKGNNAFPSVLTSVKPMNAGTNWVRLKKRFIDGRIVNARRAINVTSQGIVKLR